MRSILIAVGRPLATQSQAAELFTDLSNPLSEFANDLTPLNRCQSLINAPVDVFGDEADGAITKTELRASDMVAAEVIKVSGGMIWRMIG